MLAENEQKRDKNRFQDADRIMTSKPSIIQWMYKKSWEGPEPGWV
jgi:hypothetical protein